MTQLFVDTNIFLRYLTQDHPAQSERARDFLQSAITDSETLLVTSDAVVMELVFTLRSFYQVDRKKAAEKVTTLLGFCEVVAPEHDFDWPQVFQVEETHNIDYIDALNYRIMRQEGLPVIVSFDTDFDTLDKVTRREP